MTQDSLKENATLSRREFIEKTACAAALPAMSGALIQALERRWNILWITAEDISPDLGCYGDTWAKTPHLDRFAAEGALYENAFSIAPVCAPSRSCLITGMYPTTIGTHHMRCQGVPPEQVRCFPEYLRAAGYYCSNNKKTDYNFPAPLTAWDESSPKAHWRNRTSDQPFFSVMNFTITHESQIRLDDEAFAKRTAILTPEERHDPAEAVVPPYYPDSDATRKDWAQYYDLITAMDKGVGKLLKEMEEDGLAEKTVVFFYGDHGRGLPRGKRFLYDSGLRVPLMVRWPGTLEPGTRIVDPVSFVDFASTVLSIADVDIPGHLQGQAFLGLRKTEPRQYVFGGRDRMDEAVDCMRFVRDRQFKYIRNYQPGKPYAQYIDYMEKMPTMRELRRGNAKRTLKGAQKLFFRHEKPVEELYDTVRDPHEIDNLADDPKYAHVLERMRAAHQRWRDETHDLGDIPEEELWERVRPGGVWAVTETPRVTPNGGQRSGPVTVEMECPTKGASIAYTSESGKQAHWSLYSKPIRLERDTKLRVRACRLGYKESAEVVANFSIR